MSENSSIRASATEKPSTAAEEQGIVVTRIINAPRRAVFEAWTEPERLARWWGPRGFTSPVARIDLRVGGTYLWGMRSPDGRDFFNSGVFREIVEPERIVLTESIADADGTVVPASHYGLPGDWPAEVVMTVTLEERDGKTAMTVREEGIPKEMRGPGEAGLKESVDKLAEYLEAERAL